MWNANTRFAISHRMGQEVEKMINALDNVAMVILQLDPRMYLCNHCPQNTEPN